jgi:hypothetical protein
MRYTRRYAGALWILFAGTLFGLASGTAAGIAVGLVGTLVTTSRSLDLAFGGTFISGVFGAVYGMFLGTACGIALAIWCTVRSGVSADRRARAFPRITTALFALALVWVFVNSDHPFDGFVVVVLSAVLLVLPACVAAYGAVRWIGPAYVRHVEQAEPPAISGVPAGP